eukprot:323720-Prymnesium_polylepis.1
MDWSGVGSGLQGTVEGDDGIDEQFKELCDAAGVAPEDICRPTATPRAQWRSGCLRASAGGP